jgi:hypothetical protein
MRRPSQEALSIAVKQAIAEAHSGGLSTTHGNEIGIYLFHPDGSREYTQFYDKKHFEDLSALEDDPSLCKRRDTGNRIKLFVNKRHWSDRDFADKLGLPEYIVKAIYGGLLLDEWTRQKVVEALEIKYRDIFMNL